MNNTPTIEEIEARFDELPQDIQEAIDGINTAKIIGQIGTTNSLHFDQIQEMAACVGYLMLGFIKPQDFINELTTSARIPNELAIRIAKEVNSKILNQIKDQLKTAHEKIGKKPKEEDGDGSVGIFEHRLKKLFGPDDDNSSSSIRPSVSLPRDNDPYRETID